MFSADLFLFLSVLVTLEVHVFGCNETCPDPPVFTPSTLVVKYGDSTSAKCVPCKDACLGYPNNLEVSLGVRDSNSTSLMWLVPHMTEWNTQALCYYSTETDMQCCTTLPVTVYQPPSSVTISIVGHTGPMFEHEEYTLLCTVHNVAPVQNLTVVFYRGVRVLDKVKSKTTTKTPMTVMVAVNINTTKEDDGAKLWCQAELELGPTGPQPPVITPSLQVPATVYYGPYLDGPANPAPIIITEGDDLHLNCSAAGNPQPSYSWTLPSLSSTVHNGSVLSFSSVGFEHGGQYVCNVTSNTNMVTVNFSVHVRVNYTPYIIAAVALGVVLLFVGVITAYIHCYKQRRMGQYNLKDVFRFHAKHIAVPTEG